MIDYDILIAGGGPVGSALALALADGHRRIGVVEARADLPPTGTRAIVLADGSVRLLRALGVWSDLAADAVPVRQVEVSQQGHFGRTRITADEEQVEALGRVVAYGALARALATRARAAAGVDWIAPAEVEGADADTDCVRVHLAAADGRRTVGTRLAVAAEGTQSPLRAALGIDSRSHDYEQTALLLDVTANGCGDVAHERFTHEGTIALLPRGEGHWTLVWALAREDAERWLAATPAELGEALTERLGQGHAPVAVAAPPQAYPLHRVEADAAVAQRGVVIGNAVRTLHPVAAQGFNLALRDACALAEHLESAPDPGAGDCLAAWQRARWLDQRLTRDFTDILARGFGHGPRALAGVRAGALLGLDLCSGARRQLAAQTLGLARGLPRVGSWRPESGA